VVAIVVVVFGGACVEPRLKDDGGRGSVDLGLVGLGARSAVAELPRRLDRREPLVDQLDLETGRVGELLREGLGPVRGRPGVPAHLEGQTDQELGEGLLARQLGQRREQAAAVVGVDERPRVGHHPELVRNGDAATSLPEVDCGDALAHEASLHLPRWRGQFPKRVREQRETKPSCPCVVLDPLEHPDHKPAADMELRRVRGMNDILPEDAFAWHRLEQAFVTHAELHGYGEVRTPLLEHTALFARQMGEATDVVEKEMYSFERHDDALTVRPEGTAGAARAYVEHAVHAKEPVSRWYYLGPMFRGERPAKGRFRQFWQAGCELFGDAGPLGDAEMIELVAGFLRRVGVVNFKVHVNSLGSGDTRARFREALYAYFSPHKDKLGEDSQRRLEKNPLRILDSKNPKDIVLSLGAPKIAEILADDDKKHFEGLLHYLDVLGVDYVVDPALVRGLDYYTRTLFEVRETSGELGAQSALGGGGRYDKMVSDLGGPEVPAIGFALGLERIMASMPASEEKRPARVYLAPMSDVGADKAVLLARELREHGVAAEIDGRVGAKLKTMLKRADARFASICVILGDEAARGAAAVKFLATHAQEELPLEGLGKRLADRIASPPPSIEGTGSP
jgi:histidyl-tRNA synthetase